MTTFYDFINNGRKKKHWRNDGMKRGKFFCGLKPNIPTFHYSSL
jgi:hypothetical protein